jgi:hypothetical protein
MAKTKWGNKKITEIIKDFETKQIKVNELFNSTQEIVTQITVAATEVNKKIESISLSAGQVEETLSDAKSSTGEIQNIKNEVSELKVSTAELVKTNQLLVEEIKNQLGAAAGGSLSHTFDKRKEDLEKSKDKWKKWFLFNILALFGVALYVFLELKNNQGFSTILSLKISLAFPLIYSAIFFHSQYNKEKEYLEEYAFKSVVSFSLEAYRKLLKEEIDSGQPEERGKFLSFMLEAINKIFTSPRELISKNPHKEESIEVNILERVLGIIKKTILK